MSVFWNRRVRELEPYVPGEQPRDRQFIKLNTNENPYPPSPKVTAAIERVLDGQLRLYPDPLCTGFREAVAAAYGVKPENVFPGNGSDEVLGFAFGAFFENSGTLRAPADGSIPPLLFPDITYSFYPVYAQLWDVPHKTIPLKDDFTIDIKDYCVDNCAGVVISNPNAPTGWALPFGSAGGLEAAVKYQAAHDRVVIVDEAYAAFGAESAVPFISRYSNLLTVHTLSKSASLAGLRVGFAIGSKELIDGLYRIRDSFNSYTMDRLALAGGAAAVSDKAYYDEINSRVIAVREQTAAALPALGFEVIPSQANFIFIRHTGKGDAAPLSGAEVFRSLRDRGILVRHFNKPRIADYLRVSIGTGADMDAFLKACAEIV